MVKKNKLIISDLICYNNQAGLMWFDQPTFYQGRDAAQALSHWEGKFDKMQK